MPFFVGKCKPYIPQEFSRNDPDGVVDSAPLYKGCEALMESGLTNSGTVNFADSDDA